MEDQPRSLRTHLLETVGNFLYEEEFPRCKHTPHGILALVDALPSYTEEGTRLFPEVLLTTDLESTIAPLGTHRCIVVRETERSRETFALALKHCAPLARDGWIIFIELAGADGLRYGVLSAESSELSPSVYRHLAGDLAVSDGQVPKAYLRCLGPRQVELIGNKKQVVVQLSLAELQSGSGQEVNQLARRASEQVDDRLRETVATFLSRTLEAAVQQTHGTIIAVVNDTDESIAALRSVWTDGLYLTKPIDLVELVAESEESKSRESSTAVRSLGSVLRGMVGQDGATLLSTRGRILGYNIFVGAGTEARLPVVGGARARAFYSITNAGLVVCCVSVSHDGEIKIWEQSDAAE